MEPPPPPAMEATTHTPPVAAAAQPMPTKARGTQAHPLTAPRLTAAAPLTTPDLDLSKAPACSCAPTFSAAAACATIADTCTTPAPQHPPKFATTSCAVAACARAAGSFTRHPPSPLVPAILFPISSRPRTSSRPLRAPTDMAPAAAVRPPTPPRPLSVSKSALTLLAAVACAAAADSRTTLLQARLVTHRPPLLMTSANLTPFPLHRKLSCRIHGCSFFLLRWLHTLLLCQPTRCTRLQRLSKRQVCCAPRPVCSFLRVR
jgi:hypothetical protein